jgi:hypothetical protein
MPTQYGEFMLAAGSDMARAATVPEQANPQFN